MTIRLTAKQFEIFNSGKKSKSHAGKRFKKKRRENPSVRDPIIRWINSFSWGFAIPYENEFMGNLKRCYDGSYRIIKNGSARELNPDIYRKGLPDIVGKWKGKMLWVETKLEGQYPKPDQREFLEARRRAGEIAVWANSVEMLKNKLQELEEK